MALTFNGSSNTITGLAVGGLPDGIVDTDMLAAGAVTNAKNAIRIVTGTFTLASSTSTAGDQYGISVRKYIDHTASNVYSGFASAPVVFTDIQTTHHDGALTGVRDITTTGFKTMATCSRDSGITSVDVHWVAIGVAS